MSTPHAAAADCCHTPATAGHGPGCHSNGHKPAPAAPRSAASAHAHHGHAAGATQAGLATSSTLHCLTGCAIGEWIGLAIGVTLGWNPWFTMAFATVLAFISGYSLGLLPLIRQGMRPWQAFKTIWLGETLSIAVMEFAMNFTDYHVGGVTAGSIFEPVFWGGFIAAMAAGFAAAWPMNYWLLRRSIKQPCH